MVGALRVSKSSLGTSLRLVNSSTCASCICPQRPQKRPCSSKPAPQNLQCCIRFPQNELIEYIMPELLFHKSVGNRKSKEMTIWLRVSYVLFIVDYIYYFSIIH